MDPLSTTCVSRLTQLLELNCLEDIKALGNCSYVSQNVELEEHDELKNQPPQNAHKKKVKKVFKFLTRKETPCVFGQPISEQTVELIIELIEHLKLHASTDGLFRISGNKKRQDELKVVLNKGGKFKLNSENCQYSVHDIAGLLKQFFHELPEPLLTKQLYDCYQQLAEMDSFVARDRKIETLQFLFLLLPPLNRLLLKKLLEMLSAVARDTSNRMTAYNLGVVFAPNIVCTRKPMNCITEYTDNVEPFTELISFIIVNGKKVFELPNEFDVNVKEHLSHVVSKESDTEVPLQKTFCKQVDSKQLRLETKSNTDGALTLLYAEMMRLPDGPEKSKFIEKFKESYPGTPLFVPKALKETRNISTSSFDGSVFSSPAFRTKNDGRSHLNKFSTPHQQAPTAGLSTPASRMKQCLKRIRRRSVEIFKPKPAKMPTPEKPLPSDNNPMFSRVRDAFRRNQRQRESSKLMKKSVSTPTLARRKEMSSDSDFGSDDEARKLSFSGESALCGPGRVFNKTLEEMMPSDGRPINFNFGVESKRLNDSKTPVIRKSLYPDCPRRDEAMHIDKPVSLFKSALKDMKPVTPSSLADITNIDCVDSMKGLSLEEDKLKVNEPSYAKFKERRNYRRSSNESAN